MSAAEWLDAKARSIFEPQPIVRLEAIRILVPLALLGFMSTRIIHADDWLSTAGFHVPPLPHDWRQPAHLGPLAPATAWILVAVLVVSGLMTVAGAFTRWSAGVFAALLAYVALADRLEAFTMSKIGPVLVLALALSPSGARWSVDAWRRRRRDPAWKPPTHVSGGCVRFFQIMLPVFYFASGLAKAHGDWLTDRYVLWSHLHDSYQTYVSWFAANHFPTWSWTIMQAITLAYEIGAPLWFGLRWTRPYALVWGIGMHAMIGMMFGPVAWFGLLMMCLLIASYAPATLLDPSLVRLSRAGTGRT